MKDTKFVLSTIYSDKDSFTVLRTPLNYNTRLNTSKLCLILNNWKLTKISGIYKFIYSNTCSNGCNNVKNILKGPET